MIVLCDCENDVLPNTKTEESNWPIHEFSVRVRESGRSDLFSYIYVMPDAAKHFSLYEQYSIDRDHPHLIIDNIPNGPMNEKFMSPFNVPGQTADEMMKMVTSFLGYTLPLLVRSAKGGRGLRGSSGSLEPVVEVTSDTFDEVVLDPTKACFLLIYSPSCPASRSVLPILDNVAKEHLELQNVTIAKIDLTKNDMPVRDVVVQHYPTAYLFPAGAGDPKGHHPAWRAPINFANYKGENTPHDRSKAHSHWSTEVIAHFIEHEVMPNLHVASLTSEELYTRSHQ
jgi:thiol-disulfide isomerase/thioredoxin